MSRDLDGLEIIPTARGIELAVKVVPGASRARVVGALGPALKVAVTSPPKGGQANDALVELLAAALRVKRQCVTILAGHTQPRKRIAVRGLSVEEARQRLARL
jgi:uncharacterized protein (TIGR00251 family)